jgi:molybdate transport system regulatory protein
MKTKRKDSVGEKSVVKRTNTPVLKPRLRVMVGKEIAVGPGKVRLLQLIDETGSINRAAARMEMSYMRAWTLIRTVNRCFGSEVVSSSRGGRSGGGARLTPLGKRIVTLYLKMEAASERACAPSWAKLQQCISL